MYTLMFLTMGCFFRGERPSPSEPMDTAGDSAVQWFALEGIQGEAGALIWTPDGEGDLTLERDQGDGSGWLPFGNGSGPWWDADASADVRYRLTGLAGVSAIVLPSAARVSISLVDDNELFFNNEGIAAELSVVLPNHLHPEASVTIHRTDSSGDAWMGKSCFQEGAGETCWSLEEQALPLVLLEEGFPVLPSAVTDSVQRAVHATLTVADSTGETWDMGTSTLSYVELAHHLAWGDLHAHSNLSHDGCEEPDNECADRNGTAAADFFDMAAMRGIDFAAITDHAEWENYVPSDGPTVRIWDAQKAAVAAADGGSVIPILGYEWTGHDLTIDEQDIDGGHKTVIVEDPDACDAYRIAAASNQGSYNRLIGDGVMTDGNPFVALESQALYDAFDEAEVLCGETDVISFYHHPAFGIPQAVDWANLHAPIDPNREQVVEIYSEHGSSECADQSAWECGWRDKPSAEYVGEGSIQTALALGFQLGFVGGTDSHDSQPGSVEDGPSCPSFSSDGKTMVCHDHAGGLTGVYYQEPLDRTAIFEGIHARTTLVTSGPRVPVRAAVIAPDGDVYLPGSVLSADAFHTGRLLVQRDPLDTDPAWDLSGATIELLAPDNVQHASTESDVLDVDLSALYIETAMYVRIRFDNGEDGERIWLSPWFVD